MADEDNSMLFTVLTDKLTFQSGYIPKFPMEWIQILVEDFFSDPFQTPVTQTITVNNKMASFITVQFYAYAGSNWQGAIDRFFAANATLEENKSRFDIMIPAKACVDIPSESKYHGLPWPLAPRVLPVSMAADDTMDADL